MQTMFILTGIAIGVAVIVFMSAMLAGLQANFIKRVLTSQPQIQLLPPDEVARPLRRGAKEVEAPTIRTPDAENFLCRSTNGRKSGIKCKPCER